MEPTPHSPLDLAVIDAFGAAQALKGNRPKTEDGRYAIRYVLPTHQFQRLVVAAVRHGTPPASVNVAISASLRTDSDVSSTLWTAAEATLNMRNVSLLHGFDVDVVSLPDGSFGRFMHLREFGGTIDLSYDEGELIFQALDMQAPLITCSATKSQAFRSRIYRHHIEAFELDHSCPSTPAGKGTDD